MFHDHLLSPSSFVAWRTLLGNFEGAGIRLVSSGTFRESFNRGVLNASGWEGWLSHVLDLGGHVERGGVDDHALWVGKDVDLFGWIGFVPAFNFGVPMLLPFDLAGRAWQ